MKINSFVSSKFCFKKTVVIFLQITLLIVPSSSSSWAVYNALLCTLSTTSGCKFRIAATAIREIGSSYSSEYQRFCISWMVNLHENLTPWCTIRKSFVCWIPMINDKSSIGFQRPKSLVVVCWPVLCFLLFFELLELIDLTARRFSGASKKIEIETKKIYNSMVRFISMKQNEYFNIFYVVLVIQQQQLALLLMVESMAFAESLVLNLRSAMKSVRKYLKLFVVLMLLSLLK